MSDYDLKSSVTMTNAASPVLQKLQGDLDQTGRKFDGMGAQSSKLSAGLGALGGAAAAMGVSLGIGAAVSLGKAALEMGNVGAQSLRTEAVFRSLSGGAGEAAGLLEKLRAASGNTATDMELMQASMTPLVGVTAELRKAFIAADPTILSLAKAISDATPQLGSATELYASFSEGLRRGNPRMLESAGLVIDQKNVFDQYATSLGVTSEQLNDSQKTQALLNEVMRQSPDIIARIGTEADYAAESGDRLKTAWAGLRVELSQALAPGSSSLQDNLTNVLTSVTAAISNDAIAKQASAVKNNEAALANYIGWVGKTAEAERQRVAIVTELTATIAEQRAQLALLNAALSSGAQTKAEAEARRYAGATYDASNAMNQQEQEARRLAGTILNVAQAEAAAVAQSLALAAAARRGGDGLIAMAQSARIARGSLAGLDKAYLSAREAGASSIIGQGISAGFDDSTIRTNVIGFQQGLAKIELEYGPGNSTNKQIAIDRLRDQYTQSANDYKDSLKDMTGATNDAFSEISSLISAQLQPSFSLGDLAPELATSEGNLDEHYRRLAAIALRGGEEIAANYEDWKDNIGLIAENVRAQGVGAMQAWAKETVVAYDKGLDFSLIDRDALKARILAQLKAGEMRDAVIAELAAELGGSVSTAKLQEAAGMAVGGAGGKEVSTGIKDSIDVSGTLTLTAAAINAGAKTFEKELKASGGAVGGAILGGITEAVTGGAPDIIKRLAEALSKPVADILARDGRRTGE